MEGDPKTEDDLRRVRQKRTVVGLACALIAGGILILFVLKKVPAPMRIMSGLGDIVAGLVLLVVVRQKFRQG